jgi:hypothetical protein
VPSFNGVCAHPMVTCWFRQLKWNSAEALGQADRLFCVFCAMPKSMRPRIITCDRLDGSCFNQQLFTKLSNISLRKLYYPA